MGVIVARAPVRSQLPLPVATTECYPAVSLSTTALPSSTVDLDSLSVGVFTAAQWQVVCIDNTTGTLQTFTVYGTHDSRGTPSFVVYGLSGDTSIASANVRVDPTFMTLEVANRSSSSIQVFATRLAVLNTKTLANTLPVVEVSRLRSYVRPLSTVTVDFIERGIYQAVTWHITITDPNDNVATASVFVNLKDQSAAIGFISGNAEARFDVIITEVVGVGTELSISSLAPEGYAISVTKVPVGPQKSTVSVCGSADGLGFQIIPNVLLSPSVGTTLDEIQINSSKGVMWLATFTSSTEHTATIITSSVGTSTQPVVSPIIGQRIDMVVEHDSVPGVMRLRIQNNTPSPLSANLLRVPVAV